MTQVNIHEAERDMTTLIDRVLAGEEVVIIRDDEPVVRLESVRGSKGRRRIGGAAGLIKRMDDDFDEPLPDFDAHSR